MHPANFLVYDISGSILRIGMEDKEILELFGKIKSIEPAFENGPLATPMVKEFLQGVLHKTPDLRFSIERCLSHTFLAID